MYFTCEVHNKQFATIQALKDHVAKNHLDESESSPAKSSVRKNSKNVQPVRRRPGRPAKSVIEKSVLELELEDTKPRRLVHSTSLTKAEETISSETSADYDVTTLKCHICEEPCSNQGDLIVHLQIHFQDNLFPSFVKGVEIKTEVDFDDDVDKVNEKYVENNAAKESLMPQDSCCKTNEDSERIDNTSKSDGSREGSSYIYSCHVCSRCFKELDSLRSHMIAKHPKEGISSEGEESIADDDKDDDPDFVPPEVDEIEYRLKEKRKRVSDITTSEVIRVTTTAEDSQSLQKDSEVIRVTTTAEDSQSLQKDSAKNRLDVLIHRNEKDKQGYVPFLPSGRISCYFCGYIPAFLRKFERHIWKHTLERPYRCKICSRVFSNQEGVEEHTKTHNVLSDEGRDYKCKLCGSRFKDKTTLRRHLSTHSSHRPFSCSVCPSSHKRLFDLKRHMMSAHYGSKSYKCHICPNKEFARRDFFKFHMRTVHPGIEYEDPVSQFTNIQTTDTYKFVCHSCEITLPTYAKFLTHQREFHETANQNKVKAKARRIASKIDEQSDEPTVKRVMRSEAVPETNANSNDNDNCQNGLPESQLNKFKCHFCDGRLFNSEEGLKSHIQLFHEITDSLVTSF